MTMQDKCCLHWMWQENNIYQEVIKRQMIHRQLDKKQIQFALTMNLSAIW